jgi:hypothetical protein
MKRIASSLVAGVCLVGLSPMAQAFTVGAYAVGNHSQCGAGNIPGTVRELDKFFADPFLAELATKNFYWTEKRVRQVDWSKSGDYVASTEAASGFDGADASGLTYIASHGVTSSGLYRALTGSPQNGGCYIKSTDLELGNHMSRYTILSTCQGVKVGSGSNPSSSGENPSKTWKSTAAGTNCILGYSNNMADADGYGVYLLEKIKAGTSTLVESFFAASEAVDEGNIPAVICFGKDEADAENFINTNMGFDMSVQQDNTASAFVYRTYDVSKNQHFKNAEASFPSRVKLTPVIASVEKLSRAFFGVSKSEYSTSSRGSLKIWQSEAGSIELNKATSFMSLKNRSDGLKMASGSPVPELDEVIQIATHAVQQSGLSKMAGQLVIDSTSEDVVSGEDGVRTVIARKVRFKQLLAGFQTLGQAGSVEVSVGPQGIIKEANVMLFKAAAASQTKVSSALVSAKSELLEEKALFQVSQNVPNGEYKVVSVKYGYDAGNYIEANSEADAVALVSVEARHGEFARRHLVKLPLR